MAIRIKEQPHQPKLHTYDTVLDFGKYKGKKVSEVVIEDPKWLVWAFETIEWFDLDSAVIDDATNRIFEEKVGRHIHRDVYNADDYPDPYDLGADSWGLHLDE